VRIENSKFLDFYFAIYAITPNQTRKLEVHNCQFIDSTNNGYPLYVSASDWEADITNNEFFGGNYFYLNGKIRFENNLVNNLNSVSFVSSNGCEVLCNTFKNIKNNIDYRLSNSDSNQLNHFMYNTLDSIGDGNPSATMLNVYRSVQNNAYLGDFKITNNNFLTNLGSNKKLAFYGMNSNTSTFYLTDTRDNYWATMDSALIQSYISDYNDDINIFCMADVSSIAGSQITGCGGASFECEASYYVAVDKLNKYNIFIINNSKGTTANTTYNWTFGDGQYSANQTPTHSYNDFGKYEVCLNINDPSNTCQDQFCDSIGMDENGTLFKVTSFTISVLNEADVLDIEDLPFASTSIYPNPVDDILYIVYETGILEDVEMELVNAHGAVVAKESWSAEFGIPYHQIDLSDFAEGVYYLTLRSGNQYRMIKIVKQ
jgi:hypothetical protein